MDDNKECLTCYYCYSEPNEFEVWCHITGRIIDNGFGEGCCDYCEIYMPAITRFNRSVKLYIDSYLPF